MNATKTTQGSCLETGSYILCVIVSTGACSRNPKHKVLFFYEFVHFFNIIL